MLKTVRLGYDGKGQLRIDAATDPAAAVARLGQPVLIHEAWVDFALELSVITARNPHGDVASYVPVENRHRDHILDVTVAPAAIPAGRGGARRWRWPSGSPGRWSWRGCWRSRCS